MEFICEKLAHHKHQSPLKENRKINEKRTQSIRLNESKCHNHNIKRCLLHDDTKNRTSTSAHPHEHHTLTTHLIPGHLFFYILALS